MDGTSKKYDQPQILEAACQAFMQDYKQATLLKYASNLVYDCGAVILRLTHSKDNSEEGIIAELTFMQFMLNKGLPVVKPILSKEGKWTKIIRLESAYLTVVCFDKIETPTD